MKNNKFWLFLILMVILSLGSQLQAQVNRMLTISPTSYEASVGNQSLVFRNPARNSFDLDTLSHIGFTRVDWLKNITEDMGYNYLQGSYKQWSFDLLYFDYGTQNYSDESGIILGDFNPNSVVVSAGWGAKLRDKVYAGVKGKIINHSLHTEKATGLVIDAGFFFPNLKIGKLNLEADVAIQNVGLAPKFNDFKSELPSSLNVGLSVPLKDFTLYEQYNIYDGYYTAGWGVDYNIKDLMKVRVGYFKDDTHDLSYPSLGLDFKYDRYLIGVGYIYGDEIHPLSNTFQLTINVKI